MKHDAHIVVCGEQRADAFVDDHPYIRLRVVCSCGWERNCACWNTAIRLCFEPHEPEPKFPTQLGAWWAMYRFMERVVYERNDIEPRVFLP